MDLESTIGISTQDHLQAALLFDRLLPLHSADSVPADVRYEEPSAVREAINKIDVASLARFAQLYKMRLSSEKPPDPAALDDWFKNQRAFEFTPEMFSELQSMIAFLYQKELAKVGIGSVPLFDSEATYQGATSLRPGESRVLETTFTGIPLIDTSTITWDHVLEVRSDKDFTRKARRLRLFLADNYEGKPASYIRDSLSERIEAYEEDCRRHGLKLVLSTVSQLLESKSLLGSLGLAAAAILTGNPVVASAAALGGAVVELGKIAVSFAERKMETHMKEGREVALLVDIRKELGKASAAATSGA
jgi:hypothetical protein